MSIPALTVGSHKVIKCTDARTLERIQQHLTEFRFHLSPAFPELETAYKYDQTNDECKVAVKNGVFHRAGLYLLFDKAEKLCLRRKDDQLQQDHLAAHAGEPHRFIAALMLATCEELQPNSRASV